MLRPWAVSLMRSHEKDDPDIVIVLRNKSNLAEDFPVAIVRPSEIIQRGNELLAIHCSYFIEIYKKESFL